MTENLQLKIIFGLSYGGFLGVAFICLLFATPKRRSRWALLTLWILGLLFLLLQAGCWGAASAFGNATGGGVDDTWWHSVMAVAGIVFVIWSLFLLTRVMK